jgi:hypothetical protein
MSPAASGYSISAAIKTAQAGLLLHNIPPLLPVSRGLRQALAIGRITAGHRRARMRDQRKDAAMTTLSPALGAFGRRASRRLKLIMAAGTIALAGLATSAAPARSQTSDELIRLLLGAAAVAVVVRAIDTSSSRSRGARLPHGVLPAACMETVRMNRRHVDVYHTGCLGWYAIDRLPRRCEVQIRTDRGRRSYHVAQCLHESGWRPQYASAPSRPRHDWAPPPRSHPRHDCPPGWQGRPWRHHYDHCDRRGRRSYR